MVNEHTDNINAIFMKKNQIVLLLFSTLLGCNTSNNTGLPCKTWEEKGYNPKDDVKIGIPAFEGGKINYMRNGQSVLTVNLKDPYTVSLADEPQEWGFFQFPSIYRSRDNKLVATWHMAIDHPESYGKGLAFAVSSDGGKSWDSFESQPPVGGGLLLPSGDRIKTHTPKPRKAEEFELPEPVGSKVDNYEREFVFYEISKLPKVLQGVYLERLGREDTTWKIEQATLKDSQALRYKDFGMIPIVWWGDMNIANDGSIIAGKYPGIHLNENGKIDPFGISFYRSTNEGRSWKIQGNIPYKPYFETDSIQNERRSFGFTEPGFEILSDGSFLCVMRSSEDLAIAPMYLSRSTDLGKTWSEPEIFTSAGVMPRLLQLDNGVIVLSSGRPGVQLRFSMDNKGKKWTDPFELLPFEDVKNYDKNPVSCGYTELLATGSDSFLVIYSDFKHLNKNGEVRKAIKVKEITVKPSSK